MLLEARDLEQSPDPKGWVQQHDRTPCATRPGESDDRAQPGAVHEGELTEFEMNLGVGRDAREGIGQVAGSSEIDLAGDLDASVAHKRRELESRPHDLSPFRE